MRVHRLMVEYELGINNHNLLSSAADRGYFCRIGKGRGGALEFEKAVEGSRLFAACGMQIAKNQNNNNHGHDVIVSCCSSLLLFVHSVVVNIGQ